MKNRGFLIVSAFLIPAVCLAAQSRNISEQKVANVTGQAQAARQVVATGRQWIPRDRQSIELTSGDQSISVEYFTELLIATMMDDKAQPEKLAGEMVSLERNPKQRDQWNVVLGGVATGVSGRGADSLILPCNVFRVQRVLASTAKNPVTVRVDGQVYRLRPGEVLLLLG